MLDPQQVREIAAAACCSLNTVRAAYLPKAIRKTRSGTLRRIIREARRLNLPLPPQSEPARDGQ